MEPAPRSISISEIQQFQRCRRQWDLNSPWRQNLVKIGVPSAALHVGSGFHEALEANANREDWRAAVSTWAETEIATFIEHYTAQVGTAPSEAELAPFGEAEELVITLMERYFARYTEDRPLGKRYEYVCAEQTCAVPIPDTDGIFTFTLDGLARDVETGQLWVVEHKGQPLDATVWTPDGPRQMGEIQPGMRVCTPDGYSEIVKSIHPLGVKPIYKFTFFGGAITRTTDDHLWKVVITNHGRSRDALLTTSELLVELDKKQTIHVPLSEPVAFGTNDVLPIDPYVLGLLIGDGFLGTRQAVFEKMDLQVVEQVAAVTGTAIQTLRGKAEGKYKVALGAATVDALDELGLIGCRSAEKHVPFPYLSAQPAHRFALLQGLMDTDGNMTPGKGQVRYVTVSPQLAKDVQFLARSLGYRTSIKRSSSYYVKGCERVYTQDKYVVNIGPGACPELFRLIHKQGAFNRGSPRTLRLMSIEPDGESPAQCIKLDNEDGLYITDDFIVTHNTYSSKPDMDRLSTDHQITAYAWAVSAILGQPITGFLYDGMSKKIPTVPDLLKSGRLSERKADTIDALSYRYAIRMHGHDEADYAEILQWYDERDAQPQTPFFTRWRIPVLQAQVDAFASYVSLIYNDMVNAPAIYPNFRFDGCWDCGVRDLCKSMQLGDDVEWIKQTFYMAGRGSQSFQRKGGNPVIVDAASLVAAISA
jgi:hypothetical protein